MSLWVMANAYATFVRTLLGRRRRTRDSSHPSIHSYKLASLGYMKPFLNNSKSMCCLGGFCWVDKDSRECVN